MNTDGHDDSEEEDRKPPPRRTEEAARAQGPGRRKKPSDMPRRPLSAYNLFFKDERARILAEREASAAARRETGEAASKERGFFGTMAKTVAARWKNISPDALARYQALAVEEQKRYSSEMVQYNRRLVEQHSSESQRRRAESRKQELHNRKESNKRQKLEKRGLQYGEPTSDYASADAAVSSGPQLALLASNPQYSSNFHSSTSLNQSQMRNAASGVQLPGQQHQPSGADQWQAQLLLQSLTALAQSTLLQGQTQAPSQQQAQPHASAPSPGYASSASASIPNTSLLLQSGAPQQPLSALDFQYLLNLTTQQAAMQSSPPAQPVVAAPVQLNASSIPSIQDHFQQLLQQPATQRPQLPQATSATAQVTESSQSGKESSASSSNEDDLRRKIAELLERASSGGHSTDAGGGSSDNSNLNANVERSLLSSSDNLNSDAGNGTSSSGVANENGSSEDEVS